MWLTTSKDDAQINAASRIIKIHGRLPTVRELRARAKKDPTAFGPDAQFRYERELEPPDAEEGFTSVDRQPFQRDLDQSMTGRALLLEYDGVLCASASGQKVVTDETMLSRLPFELGGNSLKHLRGGFEEAKEVVSRTVEDIRTPYDMRMDALKDILRDDWDL